MFEAAADPNSVGRSTSTPPAVLADMQQVLRHRTCHAPQKKTEVLYAFTGGSPKMTANCRSRKSATAQT
eukprot:2653562-Pleurochrysis_carterae.AAC.1